MEISARISLRESLYQDLNEKNSTKKKKKTSNLSEQASNVLIQTTHHARALHVSYLPPHDPRRTPRVELDTGTVSGPEPQISIDHTIYTTWPKVWKKSPRFPLGSSRTARPSSRSARNPRRKVCGIYIGWTKGSIQRRILKSAFIKTVTSKQTARVNLILSWLLPTSINSQFCLFLGGFTISRFDWLVSDRSSESTKHAVSKLHNLDNKTQIFFQT